MFSGGELWTIDKQARDLSATCEKLRHRQRPKGCLTFALTLIELRRSAVNPTINQLPDRAVLIFSDISCLWPGFCFGQYLIFHASWGLLIMRW